MKKQNSLKKCVSFFLVLILCTGLFQLPGFQDTAGVAQAATIRLSKTSLTTYHGRSVRLKVSGTKKTVKWSSSDKKIATVSSKGLVKAKGIGKCTIYAKVAGKTLKCKLTVKSSIALSKKNITLHVGESTKVTLYYRLYGTVDLAPDTYAADITYGKKWDGTKKTLTVKGIKEGTTVFTFTNSENKDSVIMTVKVLPAEESTEQ